MDRGHGLGKFQRRRSRPGPILLANQRHRLVRNPAFHLDMWPNHFAHGQAPSTAKTIPAAFCQRGLDNDGFTIHHGLGRVFIIATAAAATVVRPARGAATGV